MLTKAEIREFRKMLMEKRRMILGDIGAMKAEATGTALSENAREPHNFDPDTGDISSDNHEQEITLDLLVGECSLLREIDDALERIDKGTYGICLGTGKPISKARLQARPWARYCIEYARSLERPGNKYLKRLRYGT